ncbi:MAG: Ribonuclease HI [Alphaproteobacteria bacterium MarineAlpha6_Bin4]|nr:MAG: Ribonuclease HI [Alphaproteobacteria bacterium MarineAlpha6_Bin3]PPR38085.1 MAG: Ribonuclease HI [Alphaproteobacteria bacterium MarineAlpha6_Bin4]|tara:strand:+ start:2285 stop:2722 length:438 start_codon:yes stop_codon:yes gene_type:complete
MESVDIYTDGSCIGNPGPGGWSFIIKNESKKIKEYSGSEKYTTNNRMELTAAIEAVKYFKKKTRINIYTDSKYVKEGITIWINKWKLNSWKTSNKKDVKNSDLWKSLDQKIMNHEVHWVWVKGHNENILNERADFLAKDAISKSK